MNVPVADKEFERLLALAQYQVIDTAPEASFDRVTALTAKMLGMPMVALNLVDHHRVWRKSSVGMELGESPRQQTFCAWTILDDEVNVVPDLHADPRYSEMNSLREYPELHTYAGAPLMTPQGHRIGTLCVLDTKPRDFGDAEREVLRSFASIIVTELELRMRNSALEREVSQRGQHLQTLTRFQTHADALARISELLEQDADPEVALLTVAEVLGRAAEIDGAALLSVRGGESQTRIAWTRPEAGALPLAALGELELSLQLAQRQQLLVADDPEQLAPARPELAQAGLRASAWLPLGEYLGARYLLILARSGREAPWLASDRALLQAASSIIRSTLERRASLDQALAAAHRDSLTDLSNRRAFEGALSALDASRQGFTAAVLDLDGLKGINDSEGHEGGDRLLSLFAAALKTEFRASDGVYRLGGDEFAVLLPRVSVLDEGMIFERVLRVVAALPAAQFGAVGASVGIASRDGAQPDAAQVIRQADERMYAFKRQRKAERTLL
ncbi:sensor domain-containing diguanylate cyclase [Deinococcus sp.]|uniref:sensor domain-containing diguanylate cyclase n=1 Tax=Deinococcus sp. TaxID=47478 RepID=UPI003CC6785D